MATYVLVGGAWIGSRAWQRVARELRAHGHDVYPATLTGLGERAHLARPDVDLETHIADVANLIGYEDLADVVLVGHSYAGIVVTGVADRVGDRLAELVYLDSAPAEDGESMLDFFGPPDAQAQVQRAVAERGEGWRLPVPSFDELAMEASVAGLGEDARHLMETRTVAQPFGTYTQPLRLTNATAGSYLRVVIACDDFRALVATGMPRFQVFTPPAWHRYDLATGHWPMLSMPSELAALLQRLAAER